MLSLEGLHRYFINATGVEILVVRWFGWEMSGTLGPLVTKLPASHSMWDAAGGTLAEHYGYYEGTVVKPGDWLVVAVGDLHGKPVKGVPAVISDPDLYTTYASDVPKGMEVAYREKALDAAARGGLLSSLHTAAGPVFISGWLKAFERYLAGGRLIGDV